MGSERFFFFVFEKGGAFTEGFLKKGKIIEL